jgi:hypothetical protein
MIHIIKALVRAVWWGGLAGGALFLVLTVPLGIIAAISGEYAEGVLLAMAPILLAGAGTLAGALVVGLPLTLLLDCMKRESIEAYVAAGLVGGMALPALALYWIGGEQSLFAIIPGMLAGAAAAMSWGGWREQLQQPEVQE